MKRTMYVITIAVSMGTLSATAMGAFTPEKLLEASKVSVESLRKTSPSHFPHMTGYRTWKSEDEAKTTVYIDHDGMPMEFEYVCKDGAKVECTLQ